MQLFLYDFYVINDNAIDSAGGGVDYHQTLTLIEIYIYTCACSTVVKGEVGVGSSGSLKIRRGKGDCSDYLVGLAVIDGRRVVLPDFKLLGE